ncbi:MAG: MopE-related protein [Myxococcota bacterium]|nr:MopE-related protein [Myxococcota bacterium]
MLARRASALFASVLVITLGCAQAEHSVLIEARSQGYVDSIQVTVIDVSGDRAPSRSSARPVRRTAEEIAEGEPIRIAVPLPGPMRVMVHVVATGRDPTQSFVATRCYDVAGVTRDEVLLVGPLGVDLDADGDAFPGDPGAACRDPGAAGATAPCDFACSRAEGADCDDADPDIFPGAPELCRDSVDQDCDGRDSECEDRDGDDWRSCSATDAPGTCDCEDNVAAINPGAMEICRDGIDQDCDGRDGLCDQDGDGFASDRDVGGSPDCDDTDPTVFPGATEICTPRDDPAAVARDEDCNGFIDDAADCTDDDLDRDGSPACTGLLPGEVCMRTDCDCNDCDAGIHPGALDRCGNGADEDQSGADAPCPAGDLDGDGFVGAGAGGADCDDTDAQTYPGAPERCGDGIAQSCIADVDCEGDDGDMDGYVPPADCDGATAERAPSVAEICNTVDDDCDGTTNEVLATPLAGFAYGDNGCVLGDARLGMACAGGGACITDFRTSVFHCGGCRVECNVPGGIVVADVCADGTCDCSAQAGLGACEGGTSCCSGAGCRDLETDFDNCGYCDRACDTASSACAGGECVCGALGRPCDAAMDAGPTCCGAGCVDTQNDPNNCGVCGNACGASATCSAGRCVCNPGFDNCDANQGNGCEIDLRVDLSHCGGCGNVCTRSGATATCSGSTCRIGACDTLRGDCDGMDANGCEATLTTLVHCGACGSPCSRANATAACGGGMCSIASCNAGFASCDGIDSNGCERSTRTLTDCGGCGIGCSRTNATATCATGSCAIATCNAGSGNCDGNVANGCEAPLDTLANCTACGTTCTRANGVASCASGSCQLVSCNAGFANCDGNDANGCETPLNTLANCSMCGMTCSHPNATSSCATGSCALSSCSAGFGNCDGSAANGCETMTNTLTSCGACGTACARTNATPTCATGSCMIATCNMGFGSCDGSDSNGCESSLTSLANCTACGTTCSRANATATCGSGTCQIQSCNAGFGNCDGIDSNGCETDVRSDAANCGSCGMACGASSTCSASSCSCALGFGDCNASPGCETAILGTDSANCGGCGITCAMGESCVAGACVCGGRTGTVGGGAACAPIGDSCNGGGMCRCGGGGSCTAPDTCTSGSCS